MLEWADISFAGDLPDSGTETQSHASPAVAGSFFYHCATREALLGTATDNEELNVKELEHEQKFHDICFSKTDNYKII